MVFTICLVKQRTHSIVHHIGIYVYTILSEKINVVNTNKKLKKPFCITFMFDLKCCMMLEDLKGHNLAVSLHNLSHSQVTDTLIEA